MTMCFLCFGGDLGKDGRPTVNVNGFVVHRDCFEAPPEDGDPVDDH